MAEFLAQQGATEFDSAPICASEGSHIEMCKYCVDDGATDFEGALLEASESGHLDVVRFLVEHENSNLHVTSLVDAVVLAQQEGHGLVADYLIRRIPTEVPVDNDLDGNVDCGQMLQ